MDPLGGSGMRVRPPQGPTSTSNYFQNASCFRLPVPSIRGSWMTAYKKRWFWQRMVRFGVVSAGEGWREGFERFADCQKGSGTSLLTCRLIPYPFFGYFILRLGSKNHKVGYPKKGVWYERTGRGAVSK